MYSPKNINSVQEFAYPVRNEFSHLYGRTLEIEFMNDARNFIVQRTMGDEHRYSLPNPQNFKIERRRVASQKDFLVQYTITGLRGKKLRFKFDQVSMKFIGLSKKPDEYALLRAVASRYATVREAEIFCEGGEYYLRGRVYGDSRVKEGTALIRSTPIKWKRGCWVRTLNSLYQI